MRIRSQAELPVRAQTAVPQGFSHQIPFSSSLIFFSSLNPKSLFFSLNIIFCFKGSSTTVPGCPADLREVGEDFQTTQKPTSQKRPQEAKTQPRTSARLKKKGEEDADNNEEALVSHHGVQTVLACSSQHISDYLLPIYATLINVIHKANIDLDL